MQEFLEQIPHWVQSIVFFALSIFKSYSGPTLSVVFNHSYSEMLIITFSASIFSIIVTYRFRNQILRFITRKNENGYDKKMKKFMVLWNKYGFIGTSIIAPVLISIPIGVLISAHFKTSKTKIFTFISLSAFIWSNVFYFVAKFGKNLIF